MALIEANVPDGLSFAEQKTVREAAERLAQWYVRLKGRADILDHISFPDLVDAVFDGLFVIPDGPTLEKLGVPADWPDIALEAAHPLSPSSGIPVKWGTPTHDGRAMRTTDAPVRDKTLNWISPETHGWKVYLTIALRRMVWAARFVNLFDYPQRYWKEVQPRVVPLLQAMPALKYQTEKYDAFRAGKLHHLLPGFDCGPWPENWKAEKRCPACMTENIERRMVQTPDGEYELRFCKLCAAVFSKSS